MAVASTEGMVYTISEKVIEKVRNSSFHTLTDKDGVMNRHIFWISGVWG